MRFSADKSPYKTAMGARLGGGGYVQLSSEGLAAGLGTYVMAKDQLERFRLAVADDHTGAELEAVVEQVRGSGIDVTGREVLKTAPRGYPKDHPRIELLRHKSLIAWREWSAGAWLGTSSARDRIVDFLHQARPLQDWLDINVGDSELEDAWGR